MRTAVRDSSLSARVRSRRPLRYAEGADVSLDRPAHVRAGSGLALLHGSLYVAQDDANFLARVDPVTATARAITLPAGHEGLRLFGDDRGNKKYKLDLESCAVWGDPPTLAAFGSGSTTRRDRVLLARDVDGSPSVALVDASRLYARWRERVDFSGSQLNLEGVTVAGDRVWFFQRGNGAPLDGRAPVDATCTVSLTSLRAFLDDPEHADVPALDEVTQYALGAIDGARLTFSDAHAWSSDRLYWLATAEASPDAVLDGPVTGAVLGVLDSKSIRCALLTNADGTPFVAKPEGIVVDPSDRSRAWLVLDCDDPHTPSELCEVALEGSW